MSIASATSSAITRRTREEYKIIASYELERLAKQSLLARTGDVEAVTHAQSFDGAPHGSPRKRVTEFTEKNDPAVSAVNIHVAQFQAPD